MSERLDIRGLRAVSSSSLADVIDATQVEIESWLSDLEVQGFLSRLCKPGTFQECFEPTPSGSRERERLLRSRGLRNPALVAPDNNLLQVVIAILMAGKIENARLAGAMLGQEESLTPSEVASYLPQIPMSALEVAIAEGIAAGFFRNVNKLYREFGSTDLQPACALTLTKKGRQKYHDEVAGNFRLGRSLSVLDLVVIDMIVVFNSWQSEFNPSRSAVGDALEAVVKDLNGMPGLVRPIRVVSATQAGDGAVRIDAELLNRIRAAHLFVGDLTPIVECAGRLRLNDNVLIEVGYALASKDPDQVILVSKSRPELDQNGAHVAFDIAHVRRHSFKSASDLKARLRIELETTLRRRGWLS